VIKAYQHGIGSVVLVSPFANNTGKHALAPDTSAGHPWGLPALQDADAEGFAKWFAPELAKLDAAGVRVVAFEAGNEINSSPFNADFAAPGPDHPLELADLDNPDDPRGRAVAAGYRAYLKILATLQFVRDHSQLDRTTPHPFRRLGMVGCARSAQIYRHDGRQHERVHRVSQAKRLRQTGGWLCCSPLFKQRSSQVTCAARRVSGRRIRRMQARRQALLGD
jgi:hypothetical protein